MLGSAEAGGVLTAAEFLRLSRPERRQAIADRRPDGRVIQVRELEADICPPCRRGQHEHCYNTQLADTGVSVCEYRPIRKDGT